MAMLKTFRGRPVKKMMQCGDGTNRIKLIMLDPEPGAAGEQLFVTQEEWQTHGATTFPEDGRMSTRRKLAAESGQ